MATTHKKVIVRRFLGDILHGYLPASGFVQDGHIALLDLDGRLSSIPLSDIKHVSYVRDFNLGDALNPERLTRRSFIARPRSEGLWIRLLFRTPGPSTQDNRPLDSLEGLASSDTTFLDELIGDRGIGLIPPDTRSNTQRIFVPRSSVAECQILAVITAPSRRKAGGVGPTALQDELFQAPQTPGPRPN